MNLILSSHAWFARSELLNKTEVVHTSDLEYVMTSAPNCHIVVYSRIAYSIVKYLDYVNR